MGLRNTIWFYSTAFGVIVIDQVTKALARLHLSGGRVVTVIPGFFDLRLAFNTGAFGGILPNWAPLFIIVGLVAIYVIVRLKRTGAGSMCLAIGLGMLLGGAIGNLIDRVLFSSRGVTDFLEFHIRSGESLLSWPTFNFADVGIVVGAILVVIHVYIIEKRRTEAGGEPELYDEHDTGKTQT